MEISIHRNWILINYHRSFAHVNFAGSCGRESGLALKVWVEAEEKKVQNHCILGSLVTPFPLPMLKVIVALPLKMGRMNALCSACSCVALCSCRDSCPIPRWISQTPTALESSRKIPTHSVDFWNKACNLPTCWKHMLQQKEVFNQCCRPYSCKVAAWDEKTLVWRRLCVRWTWAGSGTWAQHGWWLSKCL